MPPQLSDAALVEAAAALLQPRRIGDRTHGDVASVLLARNGNVYRGVCIDTTSGTGFCAEHAAVAAMVTDGEYRIDRIVAVWRDESNGQLFVLPPCGRCREFIAQLDPDNLRTQVLLGRDDVATIEDLLPRASWPDPY